MLRSKAGVAFPLMLTLAFLPGCHLGQVSQGRAIAFDRQTGEVTLILDSLPRADQPKYDVLPPVAVKLPPDFNETGPLPDTGKLLLLDTNKRQIILFDQASAALKIVPYAVIEEHDNVVKDDPRVSKAKLPIVDREKKTVTVYSRGKKILLTFAVPDEYLALPTDTWNAGDEIRYYYKEPGQALRMMNVSKTDLSRAGK